MYFFRLPFENMTYERKENTFVFTIWRKKVPITDIFENAFFSSIFFSNLLVTIIPLIFTFTLRVKQLFVLNFHAISKNTNEIFLPCIVQENLVRAPTHILGHPENTYILICFIFYTGQDLNPAPLLYFLIYRRPMHSFRDI